jgi:hypothetical protein
MVAPRKAVPPDRSSQGSPHVVSRFKEPAEAVFVVSRVLPLIRSRHIEQIIFSFRFSLSSQTRIDALARQGNVYQIASDSGDSVRVTVNPTWIDVAVGLGRWPSSVHGLIANPNGNINQIESRDGIVLANPFSFNDLSCELLTDSSFEILSLLQHDQIDIALITSPPPSAAITSTTIAIQPFMIVVRPDHPLAKRSSLNFAELTGYP